MNVIAYDKFPNEQAAKDENFTYVDLEEVFEKSDVEVNIFDADEMIEEVGDSELEFNDSEVSDDDLWN